LRGHRDRLDTNNQAGWYTVKEFAFADGGHLDLKLAYHTFGTLDPDGSNAVLISTAQPAPASNSSNPRPLTSCSAAANSRGHQTLSAAELWRDYVIQLLTRTGDTRA
jgi:hypothetical protein